MKQTIKYMLSLGLLSVISLSCNKDLLTPVPQTSIADVTAFDTPDRVLSQVRGLYAALKNGNFYGGRYPVYGDIRGEDFINETSNLVTGFDVWALNCAGTSQNSVKNLWAQAFYTINNCNLFIDGMNAKGSSVVGAALAANYISEAKFVRALCNYSLLQFYARPFADGAGSKPGLPLRLIGIKGSGYSDLARSSVAQTYAQIIQDLNDAEGGLPLTYTTAELNTTRAHRNTAVALKTRVFLSMQNYGAVITEGAKLVPQNTAPFSATSGVANALQPLITNIFGANPTYNTTESILSMPMSIASGDAPGTQNPLAFYFVRNGSSLGSAEYSLNPLGIIANPSWTATDIRRTALVFTNGAKKFVSKFQGGSPYLDYVPVIRYAEVLLNYAEALARTNPGVDAKGLAIVNAVRQRSDATTTITAATQQQLIDAILLERRIEFLGEGLRNNDLMRLLQTIPAKGQVGSKAPSETGYIWPISSDELSLNRLMTDN